VIPSPLWFPRDSSCATPTPLPSFGVFPTSPPPRQRADNVFGFCFLSPPRACPGAARTRSTRFPGRRRRTLQAVPSLFLAVYLVTRGVLLHPTNERYFPPLRAAAGRCAPALPFFSVCLASEPCPSFPNPSCPAVDFSREQQRSDLPFFLARGRFFPPAQR